MVRFTKKHYKAIMHAYIVADIVETHYNGVDKAEIINQSYELMIDNDGYDVEDIIDIMMEKAQEEQESYEVQEYNVQSTVDPAFASWEECNRQFI